MALRAKQRSAGAIDLDQTPPQTFTSSVCIVGAGIAGLVLATRLAALGLDVHLLEAGGLGQEERSQAFYATEQPADLHRGAHEGRFRTFGGSSTRWGGQLLPFTADVFAGTCGAPPWPITADELVRFYPEVERMFGADHLPFDATLLGSLGHPAVAFSPAIALRFSKWAPFARRNVAQTLGPGALEHPLVTVFTHANAVEIVAASGRATAVRVINYAGDEFCFQASQIVVASGTIESCRLLLASAGVSNSEDQLGRYFHDHLSFHAAEFASPARESMLEKLGPFFVSGTLHTCKLEASTQVRQRAGLLACMAHVVIEEPEDSGAAAVRNLLRALQAGRMREALGGSLVRALRGSGDILRIVYQARVRRRRAVSRRAKVFLNIDVEQVPNADNRIRLSPERDALGMPRAIVDWRVHPLEQQTALAFARDLLRPELERLRLAPAVWDPSIAAGTLPAMADTYHAMGGLRMGTNPATSVVDANLRLHTLSNLFVASCAVFPSGSSSNPTFTLVALALRLAEHLAR